jgi:hypothetical protein
MAARFALDELDLDRNQARERRINPAIGSDLKFHLNLTSNVGTCSQNILRSLDVGQMRPRESVRRGSLDRAGR